MLFVNEHKYCHNTAFSKAVCFTELLGRPIASSAGGLNAAHGRPSACGHRVCGPVLDFLSLLQKSILADWLNLQTLFFYRQRRSFPSSTRQLSSDSTKKLF